MRKYRILIYYRYPILPTRGGVERVSVILGEWLMSIGHQVYYLSDIFEGESPVFIHNNADLDDDDNFSALETFVNERKIDFILNQSAFMPSCRRLFELRGSFKIISIFHHSLDGMFAHPPIPFVPHKYGWLYSRNGILENLFRWYFYIKYHKSLKFIVGHSDKVVVLSKYYIRETQFFSSKADNIVSIGNPLTLPICNEKLEKENMIVFVGRLSWPKNPFLLLKIWCEISSQSNNWDLYILGDGEEKRDLEKYVVEKKISNVHLEGNQDPIPYLKKAKILCMTSLYEGFPLVLYEAMNFGVVPVVFNTFQSVQEIITDGKDGYVVEPFKIAEYREKVMELMRNSTQWEVLSNNAQLKSRANTIDAIGEIWLNLFDNL